MERCGVPFLNALSRLGGDAVVRWVRKSRIGMNKGGTAQDSFSGPAASAARPALVVR
jgi:hypothetical protein